MYNSIMRQFGLHEQGYTLKADFSHLQVMQDDEEKTAQTMKLKAETLEKIIALGVAMNPDEIKNLLHID
jgi:hypothetical protein